MSKITSLHFSRYRQNIWIISHLILYTSRLRVPQVHVGGERNVLEVIEKVCHGHAGEDHVDGVPHVLVGEHQDVGQVEQGAHHAH